MNTRTILINQLQKVAEGDAPAVDGLLSLLPQRVPELWRRLVIGAYLDDQINLGKAAELLGARPMALRQEFQKAGIPIKIGVESLAEIESDAETLRKLRNDRR
jgi:predicted HTH domain antitoxin